VQGGEGYVAVVVVIVCAVHRADSHCIRGAPTQSFEGPEAMQKSLGKNSVRQGARAVGLESLRRQAEKGLSNEYPAVTRWRLFSDAPSLVSAEERDINLKPTHGW
jgi:hypothetical protein